VNEAVGGAATSAHVFGYAVDFNCHRFGTPLEVAKRLEKVLNYDQLIHEFNSWVHISFDPKTRNQELTVDRKGTRPGLLPGR
jgi:putative chitinase